MIQGLLAAVMVVWGSFDQLLGYVVLIMLLASMATGLAHLILRVKQAEPIPALPDLGISPDAPGVYRGLRLDRLADFLGDKPGTSLLGVLITPDGIAVLFLLVKRKLKKSIHKRRRKK